MDDKERRMAKVTLNPLTPDDREQFIRDNQEALTLERGKNSDTGMTALKKRVRLFPMRPLSGPSTAARHTGSYMTAGRSAVRSSG